MSRPADRIRSRTLATLAVVMAVAAMAAAETGDDAMARGEAAFARGAFGEAASHWRDAAERAAAAEDARAELAARLRLGAAERSLGSYASAATTLARARALAEAQGDPVAIATVRGALGDLYGAAGDPDTARRELEAAAAVAEAAGATRLAAATLTNLGNQHASGGRIAAARDAQLRAAELAEAAGDASLAARALANAARAELRLGHPEVGLGLVDRAGAHLADVPDRHDKAFVLLHLARTVDGVRDGLPEQRTALLLRSHGLLGEAHRIAAADGDARSAAYAQGYLGALYGEQGRYAEALELTERAIADAERSDTYAEMPRWNAQAGRLLAQLGRSDAAIARYAAAVAGLQHDRHAISASAAAGDSDFRERQGQVYSEYVDLLLRRAASAEGDAAQADLLRAQESMELLKAAELRDYFRDECVDAALARQVSVGGAAADTAVVYPILLEDRTELLVTTSKGIERASVPVGAVEMTREIRRFRELLTKRTTREFLRPAQRLHAWLIAPLAQTLAASGVRTLVFVPDGPLRSIPMSALHDGETFLIQRYAVAVTPGLRLADPRALDPETLRILLAGLTEPTSGYEALPGVREELTAVAELYGGDVLLDDDFAASAVEQKLASEPFNVVHIASHAEFSGDSRSTFLLTHDGRMSMQELADYVGLFRYRDTPLELLALSACETAAGDDRAALGLSGIAVKAGARSALGTLWRVNDEAASQVVVGFYRALGVRGVTRAMALQRAQQAMLAQRSTRHPAYWAAFVLIGNWL